MSYQESERNIFKYHNGTKTVCADPVKVHARMLTSYPPESSIEHDFKLIQVKLPDTAATDEERQAQAKLVREYNEAFLRMAQWAYKTFDLKELDEDGGGVTVDEALKVHSDFLEWVEGLKKSTVTPPTSPPPTDSTAV